MSVEYHVFAGGQPGSALAWDDDLANHITNDFFRNTRASIDRAYVRPRHTGMAKVQVDAGATLHRCLAGLGTPRDTVAEMQRLFAKSLNR